MSSANKNLVDWDTIQEWCNARDLERHGQSHMVQPLEMLPQDQAIQTEERRTWIKNVFSRIVPTFQWDQVHELNQASVQKAAFMSIRLGLDPPTRAQFEFLVDMVAWNSFFKARADFAKPKSYSLPWDHKGILTILSDDKGRSELFHTWVWHHCSYATCAREQRAKGLEAASKKSATEPSPGEAPRTSSADLATLLEGPRIQRDNTPTNPIPDTVITASSLTAKKSLEDQLWERAHRAASFTMAAPIVGAFELALPQGMSAADGLVDPREASKCVDPRLAIQIVQAPSDSGQEDRVRIMMDKFWQDHAGAQETNAVNSSVARAAKDLWDLVVTWACLLYRGLAMPLESWLAMVNLGLMTKMLLSLGIQDVHSLDAVDLVRVTQAFEPSHARNGLISLQKWLKIQCQAYSTIARDSENVAEALEKWWTAVEPESQFFHAAIGAVTWERTELAEAGSFDEYVKRTLELA